MIHISAMELPMTPALIPWSGREMVVWGGHEAGFAERLRLSDRPNDLVLPHMNTAAFPTHLTTRSALFPALTRSLA